MLKGSRLRSWTPGHTPDESLPSAEYQVDTQPLRPCELQRGGAFQERADYVPQCTEDGSFQ